MSYKTNDLKRLKKDELLALFDEEDVNKYKKLKKAELVHLLSQTTPSTSGARCQVTGINNFADPVYEYGPLSDDELKELPTVTFSNIYSYFRGDDEYSSKPFKALDRAVKHTSAGDITSVCFVKVGSRPKPWVCCSATLTVCCVTLTTLLKCVHGGVW
jgi:hypothetical protein